MDRISFDSYKIPIMSLDPEKDISMRRFMDWIHLRHNNIQAASPHIKAVSRLSGQVVSIFPDRAASPQRNIHSI